MDPGGPGTGGTEGRLKVERRGPGLGHREGMGEGAVGTLVPHQVSSSSSRAGQDPSRSLLEVGSSRRGLLSSQEV